MEKHPYIEYEKEIMDSLVASVNFFSKLKTQHPSHRKDFTDGIHKCQNVIMHRILQRDYPEKFPTYKVQDGFSNLPEIKVNLEEMDYLNGDKPKVIEKRYCKTNGSVITMIFLAFLLGIILGNIIL